MLTHPAAVLTTWLFGLLSLGLPIVGGWALTEWYQRSHQLVPTAVTETAPADEQGALPRPDPPPASVLAQRREFRPDFGLNAATAFLAVGGLALLLTLCGGSLLMRVAFRPSGEQIRQLNSSETLRLRQPDGAELHIERYGAVGRPVLVFTHGLGTSHHVWDCIKQELSNKYRLIVWDMPGMGQSTQATDRSFEMERLSGHLRAVVGEAQREAAGQPVVLVGHSAGGMLNLELCKNFGNDIAPFGLVQVHTTYTNPVRTLKNGEFYEKLQEPVLKPLLYLVIGLSPLVRLLNTLSYLNGSAHWSTWRTSFAGRVSYEQVDFAARYYVTSSPAVQARLNLALLRWDASETLRRIEAPVLVVAGDQDEVCRPGASDRMHADMPSSRLVTLSPARHMGFFQYHRDFGRQLDEFVRSIALDEPAAETRPAARLPR